MPRGHFQIGNLPQEDFSTLTHAQLTLIANTFYNEWVASNRECERLRQQLESSILLSQKDKSSLEGERTCLATEVCTLRERLSESFSVGVALHRRAAALTLALTETSSNCSPPALSIVNDALVQSQARVLFLERLLRTRVTSATQDVFEENAVLRQQRSTDVQTIEDLTERLAAIQSEIARSETNACTCKHSNVGAISPTTQSLSRHDVLGFREADAGHPSSAKSRSTQTSYLPPNESDVSTYGVAAPSAGSTRVLQDRVRWLERSLQQRERDLIAAVRLDGGAGADEEGLALGMLASRLKTDLEHRDQSLREAHGQIQRLTERLNFLSMEAQELRAAVHEARVSRDRLRSDLKSARVVTPARLKELQRVADSVDAFESQKAFLQRRDQICGELEVYTTELRGEMALSSAKLGELASSHARSEAECETLRGELSKQVQLNSNLMSRLALIELSASPSRSNVGVQSDLVAEEVADLKWQLTMSMNDSRYLEHEVLIRDLYIRGIDVLFRKQ